MTSPHAQPLAALGITPAAWDRFRAPFAATHAAVPGDRDGAARCVCGAPMLVSVPAPESCRVLAALVGLAHAAEMAQAPKATDYDVAALVRLAARRARDEAAEP